MPARFVVILILSAMPLVQARLLERLDGQQKTRVLRVLVEGEPAVVSVALQAVQTAAFERGIRIIPIATLTEPCDTRLIIIAGSGSTWDTNPSIPAGTPQFPVDFGFSTVVVLTPDGKLLFTVNQSGNTAKAATIAAAKESVKRLSDHYATETQKQGCSGSGENRLANPSAGAQASAPENLAADLPADIGVYYLESGKWIAVSPVAPSQTNIQGMAKGMLTWGISGLAIVQAYHGPSASTQIFDRRPTFYVRGAPPSSGSVWFVRLEEKRDRRELRVARATAWNMQAGLSSRDVTEAVIVRVGQDVIAITPRSDLGPGEYILRLVSPEFSDNAYDFRITR